MNESFPYSDIILLALIAGFILLRLRSTLGHNAELPERPIQVQKPEKPITAELLEEKHISDDDDASFISANFSDSLAGKLKEIRRLDPSFRARAFLDGAKIAFEMVITALSQSDKKTLKSLLTTDVFNSFSDELQRRKTENITHETTLIAISGAEIADASVTGTKVGITVKFRSEQVNLVRSQDGAIIDGDPSEIEQVDDVWIFERDTKSNDPNWKLAATNG